jgi:hypothetical protein
MKHSDDNAVAPADQVQSNPARNNRQEIEREINRLKFFSNRGLWAFSLFLFVCILAWRDFPLLPLPDSVIAALGPPPSSRFISLMLVFYTFSAVILSLSRMMSGAEHKSSFCHVGYLTVFFLFYHFAKSLDDNFWAVFGAGVTILVVESYRIWSFCTENIALKHEQLEYLAKTGHLPPEE